MEPSPQGIECWWSEVTDAILGIQEEQKRFYEHFPEWKRTREHTISVLLELANHLDKTKKSTTKARIAGSSASLVGGITSLTSVAPAAAALVPAMASTLIVVAPLALIVGGTVTALGSIVVKEMKKKSDMKIVKDTLEIDREVTEVIVQFAVRNQELRRTIENVMSVDVFNEIIEDFKQLFRDLISDNIEDERSRNMQDVLSRLWLKVQDSHTFDASISFILTYLITTGLLVKLIRQLGLKKSRNVIIFECLSATLKIASVLTPIVITVLHGATSAANTYAVTNRSSALDRVVPAARMALAVGMVMDCYSAFQAIKDLYTKSPSDCASKIRETVNKLKEELESFTNVFEILSDQYDFGSHALLADNSQSMPGSTSELVIGAEGAE